MINNDVLKLFIVFLVYFRLFKRYKLNELKLLKGSAVDIFDTFGDAKSILLLLVIKYETNADEQTSMRRKRHLTAYL